MPSAATWMDLENIMLSEISETLTNTVYTVYVWNLKNSTNDVNAKQKQTH